MPEVEILEYNIQIDHIHLMLVIPPRYGVSCVVGKMKGNSAYYLGKRFKWMKKLAKYNKDCTIWSQGYFVSTVGIDENVIRNYIKYQQAQDSGQAKLVF